METENKVKETQRKAKEFLKSDSYITAILILACLASIVIVLNAGYGEKQFINQAWINQTKFNGEEISLQISMSSTYGGNYTVYSPQLNSTQKLKVKKGRNISTWVTGKTNEEKIEIDIYKEEKLPMHKGSKENPYRLKVVRDE